MRPRSFRYWFYAASIYNLIWGGLNIFAPRLYFQWIGMTPPVSLPIWQVLGMFVLVYAPAYWWAARYPERHYHLILLGLIGKTLGPIGFVWSLLAHQLPLSFGWVILTNDLIWLPAFLAYFKVILSERSAMSILRGE